VRGLYVSRFKTTHAIRLFIVVIDNCFCSSFICVLYHKRESGQAWKDCGSRLLHCFAFKLYMIYNRIRSRGLALPDYHSIFGIHIIFGILSILLAIIFVANWWKWKKKRYMDLGILLWTVTFLLGIAIYMRIYGLP
jgi:hypothetical protein